MIELNNYMSILSEVGSNRDDIDFDSQNDKSFFDLFEIKSHISTLDLMNSSPNKQPLFIINKKKNRGRKINEKNYKRKIHTNNYIDNILCKLQIHFINFLVDFSNDAIKTIFSKDKNNKKLIKDLRFKKIEHGIKRDIKIDSLQDLMEKPISYILQKKISNKYRKLSRTPDYNEQIYNIVIKSSEWLKNLFDMNYLELFEKYYNQCRSIDSIYFEGITIVFSNETKPFYYSYKELNTEIKEKIIQLIKDLYIRKSLSLMKLEEFPKSI